MLIATKEIYKTFLLKDKISYKDFDSNIKRILKLIRDQMIDGEKIATPFGTLSIKEKERSFHKPSINIVESMIEKKRLIDNGEKPYEVIKNSEGKIIGDNGGEKYFRYFMEDTFFSICLGVHGNRFVEAGNNTYKFIPAASTERLRRKKLKKDKLITLRYAEN